MIVPRYWAEGRCHQPRSAGSQITVRRFGWSDVSQEEAQRNADARAEEAFNRVISGEKLPRRERKIPYNGAEGLPIREEIIAQHGENVITRNSYGALCLNTPNVLFADIDFENVPPYRRHFAGWLSALLITGMVGWRLTHSASVLSLLFLVTLLLYLLVVDKLRSFTLASSGGIQQRARRRVDAFVAQYPDWHLRLYQTPAGLRLLAMHQTFDPASAQVSECFRELGVDRLYARMCANQHCFRARVSPKPWRIGIDARLRPRPGVWPVKAEHLPARVRWVEDYERQAHGYASCRFVEALGNQRAVDPAALAVQKLHDALCQAEIALPIA